VLGLNVHKNEQAVQSLAKMVQRLLLCVLSRAQWLLQKHYCTENLRLPGNLESVFFVPLNLPYFGEEFVCQLHVSKYAI
jgi:hypothetical protein